METLLLEIGTEEIPAGYIKPALDAISDNLIQKLDDARIAHGPAYTSGTPRRLVVSVDKVAAKQSSITSEVIGPPAKVGFDSAGKPTVAARKFAEKVGQPVEKLSIKRTEKGEYLCARITERGQSSRMLLKEILPQVILATPFPKKMRWADLDIEFARPIHSLLALLGDTVVTFKLGNLKSNRYTRGHYFMSTGKIKIANAAEYFKKLKDARVIVDIEERKRLLRREVEKVSDKLGGNILPDEELLDINTNLVEYPVVVAGHFDDVFLEVPDEVLINAMREHQKYFSVVDEQKRLMPYFISVNNTRAKSMKLVSKGHERVIRARLADAQFFYRGDLEVSNDTRIEKLKGVLFQAKLGTLYEKSERVAQLADYLVSRVGEESENAQRVAELRQMAVRAARLCKSDLVSAVVGEFPKLQGVMGRVYAEAGGEPSMVATAVEEHYRPVYSGAPLPETLVGAVVSIADKVDSICGCFSVGLIPTGASDPYALRRQGIGIVQIMQDKSFAFSLRELIVKSLELYGSVEASQLDDLVEKIYTFIKNRISHLMVEDGFAKDVVAAVVNVTVDNVPTAWRRVSALQALKHQPDFDPLVAGFKRVVNIIKKSAASEAPVEGGPVETALFEHRSESNLYSAYQTAKQKVDAAMSQGQYDRALKEIASLRDPVDAFFEDVMVMTDNVRVRSNRLNLLDRIAHLFGQFADFSKIAA
jgi:glycyl-tRNA synthetase beta chain